METYHLDHDITILCVAATSFPDGVMAAHQKLHAIISHDIARRYFSISHGSPDHSIIYKAGAETHDINEATALNLETFVIQKGEYSSIIIDNYMNNTPAIGKAFEQLLKEPRLDPQGVCVEWYISREQVQCMVRLIDKTAEQ